MQFNLNNTEYHVEEAEEGWYWSAYVGEVLLDEGDDYFESPLLAQADAMKKEGRWKSDFHKSIEAEYGDKAVVTSKRHYVNPLGLLTNPANINLGDE